MRLGVDLGGTAIKSGLVDDQGQVHFAETVPTNTAGGADAVLESLTNACRRQLARGEVSSVGIGMPGRVDAERGILVDAANLPLVNVPLAQLLSQSLDLPVYLENDANCALYGEIFAGGGREVENLLLVTIGTGVGGGIRLGGKIYRGKDGRAGEFGHAIVEMNGLPCPCGRIGCWEQYASTTALCRLTRETAQAAPESILARQIAEKDGEIDGRTVFAALEAGCPEADKVLDRFTGYLAIGLNNLITVFRPQRIVLAGGILREKEQLLPRIRSRCLAPDCLASSTLDGQAGLIGASLLGELRQPDSPIAKLLSAL